MAVAKILVLYPAPRDAAEFERLYTEEHAPMVTPQTFPGLTRFVASRVVATPDGSAPRYVRVAELHFPSMNALQNAAASPAAQEASFRPSSRRNSSSRYGASEADSGDPRLVGRRRTAW